MTSMLISTVILAGWTNSSVRLVMVMLLETNGAVVCSGGNWNFFCSLDWAGYVC